MRKLKCLPISIILAILFSLAGPSFEVFARPLAATSPTLGASASYSVLAGSTVTNVGSTTISENVGVAPGTAITGFPPGIVGPPGAIHANDASAIAAQADNLVVFGTLNQPCDHNYGAVDLTATFPAGVGPGVYCSSSSFSLSGNLQLIGSGVWIFKTVSTLITSPGASVMGGNPCNVWWRIGSSATLDTNTTFQGNIFALTSITMNTNAVLHGRALAQTGAVTLQFNTINGPICAQAPTSTPTATLAPTATRTAPPPPPPTSPPPPAPTPLPMATPTAMLTGTPAALLTATAIALQTPTLLPLVTGLPSTGGAPIRNEDFPWSLPIIAVFGVMALLVGIRAYRSNYRPKR